MTRFTPPLDLQGAEFIDVNLRDARFVGADLSGAVMRGVQVGRVEIEAPWLFDDEGTVTVNGVDVRPFVDAELDARFPGRAGRHATDPVALRHAWDCLERSWADLLERVGAMPAGTVEVSVGGEWSFAQTLRHLVLATDMWLGRAILRIDQPFHPVGLLDDATEADDAGARPSAAVAPSYDVVLEARRDRVSMVRAFLSTVSGETLAEPRANPHDPSVPETVLSCLHTILDEEWEHQRYAVRDLDTLAAQRGARPG